MGARSSHLTKKPYSQGPCIFYQMIRNSGKIFTGLQIVTSAQKDTTISLAALLVNKCRQSGRTSTVSVLCG
uniref:Uncharacterized protein n=1 Tax=Rhizophora mucronata TaxID=61149 RepID=A0A2P2MF22_RHIMU